MATSEIDDAHGLPRDIVSLTNELQQVLHDVGKLSISNGIQSKSAQRYACRVIQSVNREEEEAEGEKRKTGTGTIKKLVLSHKRSKQSDPRLAWFMLHKIYCMYIYIKNKEEINAAMLITSRSTQVWNYGKIGLDPDGRWNKFICTYKIFQGEIIWKLQTGE